MMFSPDNKKTFASSDGPVDVATQDLNYDGKLDVVVSTLDNDKILIYTGVGDGNVETSTSTTAGSNPAFIDVGDVDKDGYIDIVSASTGNAYILLNESE
jgi:hypothetical protein